MSTLKEDFANDSRGTDFSRLRAVLNDPSFSVTSKLATTALVTSMAVNAVTGPLFQDFASSHFKPVAQEIYKDSQKGIVLSAAALLLSGYLGLRRRKNPQPSPDQPA